MTEARDLITIQHGMSGWFAVHLWKNPDGDYWEPYDTGFGRYYTPTEAALEAKLWSDECQIPLAPDVYDYCSKAGV